MKWIKVEDELPPITESFKDGMNYHDKVIGWFVYFRKDNARECCLWTCKGVDDRWMVSGGEGYGISREPPTHWMPLITAPE